MKNKKILIISIAAVILIILGVLAALYFTTDLFKTEQQLFYKYLGKIELIEPDFIKQYNAANDKIMNNNYSSSANLDVSIKTVNKQMETTNTQKLLTIKSDSLNNISSKQYYRDFNVSLSGMNLLALKYLKDNNTYGIMEDKIITKYLAVENANLKQLFKNMGAPDETISEIPDSIDENNNKEIYEIDEKTLETLKKTYSNVIYNNISKENFFKIANEDKTKTIGVSLSEQDIMNLYKILLDTAKNDTVLLNLIVNKAKLLKYDDITIENLQTEIQKVLDDIRDTTNTRKKIEELLSSIMDPLMLKAHLSYIPADKDFIKIAFMVKEEKIIKIEFETNLKEETIKFPSFQKEVISTTDYKYKIVLDLTEQNKITLTMQEDEEPINTITLFYEYNDEKIELAIELRDGTLAEYTDNVAHKINYKISGYNTEDIVCDLEVNVYDIMTLSMNQIFGNTTTDMNVYNLKLVDKIKLKQDIKVPNLTTENSLKLNDLNSEQLNNLFMAISDKISEVYAGYFGDKMDDSIFENAENAQKEYEEVLKKEEETLKEEHEKIMDYLENEINNGNANENIQNTQNVKGTLEEIMAKVYEGIPAENLPMMLKNMPIDSENVEYYIGTKEVPFKEGIASESMIGSIPHSVVLLRAEDTKAAKSAVDVIKESANPRKWICVEASNVVVESKGELVILIMSDTEATPEEQHLAPMLLKNFKNL